ncbi:MAG: hypothetical protein JKY92_08185, partial [Magnetovibrio sp.]|nr:hypothetical protein [Magnetovibrio sp.]
ENPDLKQSYNDWKSDATARIETQNTRANNQAQPPLPPRKPEVPKKNIEDVIGEASKEYPDAKLRITGQGRTVKRQAELMAQRRMTDRKDFMGTYKDRPHIREMDKWVKANPNASEAQVTKKFEGIIRKAQKSGYKVSGHLSDHARDISNPQKNKADIRKLLEKNGIRVLDEGNASTGAHWHLDY